MEETALLQLSPLLESPDPLHTLNHCPVALQCRRYNQRHDAVLELLHQFTCNHTSSQQQVIVDLPDQSYYFPASFSCTNSRPDLVIWNKDLTSIHLIELTVPFETTMEDAAARKRERYREVLLHECYKTARVANLTTIEVGSRGFLNLQSFQELYEAQGRPQAKDCRKLEVEVIKTTLVHSHQIWCKRNWNNLNPPVYMLTA